MVQNPDLSWVSCVSKHQSVTAHYYHYYIYHYIHFNRMLGTQEGMGKEYFMVMSTIIKIY